LLGSRTIAFVATEVVAAALVAVVQTNQGATPKEVILGAGAVVGALGVLWVLVRFLVRPMLHNWFFAVLASEPVRTTEAIVESFDKSDRTRAMTRGFVDRLYADKIATDTETRDLAEANRDAIRFLEESNVRQGEAITKELARAMEKVASSNEAQTRSQQETTRVLDEIRRELNQLAKAYERLDERQQHYEGPERRQRPR
jgi:hypothetical protein